MILKFEILQKKFAFQTLEKRRKTKCRKIHIFFCFDQNIEMKGNLEIYFNCRPNVNLQHYLASVSKKYPNVRKNFVITYSSPTRCNSCFFPNAECGSVSACVGKLSQGSSKGAMSLIRTMP